MTQTIVRESETIYSFDERVKVTRSSDAEKVLRPLFTDIDEVESFHVLIMSRANEIITHKLVGLGGTAECVVDPKVIFRYALSVKGCAGLIVAHNHPSGSLVVSDADLEITKKLKLGGKYLDLQLLDHVILTPAGKYLSFADEGLL